MWKSVPVFVELVDIQTYKQRTHKNTDSHLTAQQQAGGQFSISMSLLNVPLVACN